ncbi:hypothetical protein PIB30_021106 [Stylosanthes scabra]|uniref:Uncharacterized protein n=1 Tax=Stylosanthes scabra TaxID=79078 RepID=A0ABU6Z5C7_9FABA|nr:hypothetical protein [Stylosanthes scabra]
MCFKEMSMEKTLQIPLLLQEIIASITKGSCWKLTFFSGLFTQSKLCASAKHALFFLWLLHSLPFGGDSSYGWQRRSRNRRQRWRLLPLCCSASRSAMLPHQPVSDRQQWLAPTAPATTTLPSAAASSDNKGTATFVHRRALLFPSLLFIATTPSPSPSVLD